MKERGIGMWLNTIVPASMAGLPLEGSAEAGHTQIVSLRLETNRSLSLRLPSSLPLDIASNEAMKQYSRGVKGLEEASKVLFRHLQTLKYMEEERQAAVRRVHLVFISLFQQLFFPLVKSRSFGVFVENESAISFC